MRPVFGKPTPKLSSRRLHDPSSGFPLCPVTSSFLLLLPNPRSCGHWAIQKVTPTLVAAGFVPSALSGQGGKARLGAPKASNHFLKVHAVALLVAQKRLTERSDAVTIAKVRRNPKSSRFVCHVQSLSYLRDTGHVNVGRNGCVAH